MQVFIRNYARFAHSSLDRTLTCDISLSRKRRGNTLNGGISVKKKLVAILSLLLLSCALLMAVEAPFSGNLVLSSNIPDGSGIIDGGDVDNGGEDPVLIDKKLGIYLVVVDSLPSSWPAEFKLDLVRDTKQATMEVDLAGSTTQSSADEFYIAVGAMANVSGTEVADATVTFGSNGWTRNSVVVEGKENEPSLSLDMDVESENGIFTVSDQYASTQEVSYTRSTGMTIEAPVGTNNTVGGTPELVGVCTVSWTQSPQYSAGEYSATIAVSVTAK